MILNRKAHRRAGGLAERFAWRAGYFAAAYNSPTLSQFTMFQKALM